MNEHPRDHEREPGTGTAKPAQGYEPPRVERLGSLRDLLAVKSITGVDGPFNMPGKH